MPPRPPLTRADSRSGFPLQPPRPGGPVPPQQQRPQFQPGGPVTSAPQFVPRPGTPVPRGPAPTGPSGVQQTRQVPPPLRPTGPQSFAPQGPRPLQSPTSGQPPQRVPPPNNLQFGPRQASQFGGAIIPDGTRPQIVQQPTGAPKNGPPGPVAASGQLPRQPSQGSLRGLDQHNPYQNKPANLDNQSATNDNQNAYKPENGSEIPGMAKGRSFSIAAAPGAPSPLKMEDDRRKSVSAIGGRVDEFASRSPGLGLIQEGKIDSKDNVRDSKESVRSEASNDGKDVPERPESRLSGSKMTESFMGSIPNLTPNKKSDDNDDVILQNNAITGKSVTDVIQNQNKPDISDRSPSLTRSDDSPELKQNVAPTTDISHKSQSATPEPQRPKTTKTEVKPDIKQTVTPNKVPPKSPVQDTKPPVSTHKKPHDLYTSADSKKSTPRKTASAPKSRTKGILLNCSILI